LPKYIFFVQEKRPVGKFRCKFNSLRLEAGAVFLLYTGAWKHRGPMSIGPSRQVQRCSVASSTMALYE
jgi:hypothetical protein